MEEIKVGEYVRTVDGIIANVDYIEKIEYISKHKVEKTYYFDKTIYYDYEDVIDFLLEDELDKYITNHSPNLIDLIEVGDYVNGKEILRINDYGEHKRVDFNLDYDDCDAVYNEDIKSIVTKEMIESIKYEVE